MCAGSNTNLKQHKVELYLGYYGGKITIGDVTFKQGNTTERRRMFEFLSNFEKNDIISMFLDLIDNSDE